MIAYIASIGLIIALSTESWGFPVDLSTVNNGQFNSIWLASSPVLTVIFVFIVVFAVFGCVCCRPGKGFEPSDEKNDQEFRNSNNTLSGVVDNGYVNPRTGAELTIFPPAGASANGQIVTTAVPVRLDPPQDAKQSLRPASFSSSERPLSSQDWFYEPYNNFPRGQLQYVQDYGRGWFGRVVEGEAVNICPPQPRTKVIVKILHEDATLTDQMFFLHEVKHHRDLNHPNILRLLGRCLETEPFLLLLEHCPNGDLKTFLSQNHGSAQALTEQGVTLRMARDVCAGLEFMHQHKFIHTDLAARNCLVTPDLSIKIGDYGNAIELFREDYYIAGSVALPVRWCAPETLKCTDLTIETKEVTTFANVWTLAVVIWELCEFGRLPYDELSDDQVISRVLGEKTYVLTAPKLFCLHKEELYRLMKLCWTSPFQRPTCSQIRVILDNLVSSGGHAKTEQVDFDQRWQVSKPNTIPKTDNTDITVKPHGAKIADSNPEAPIEAFMADSKASVIDSPRFRLRKSDSTQNVSGSLERLNRLDQEHRLDKPELDSWLKGVEVNNEEDENFVRNISEAIRDLDAALAMEKTSSSEETSGKSSKENSPSRSHKIAKQEEEYPSGLVVDFKLGGDTSSFMSLPPKSFELSSLQNTLEPQSLTFTSLIFPEPKLDTLLAPSFSDTEDELWKTRIERGEFSEKVKEKSKSIADLMVLTHIDPSDDSDEGDRDRNSFTWKPTQRSSLSSNNFGSDSDIRHAVLKEDFEESLKKLSSEHKEYGRFDSLNMFCPDQTRRESVLKTLESNATDDHVFLDNVASENCDNIDEVQVCASGVEEISSSHILEAVIPQINVDIAIEEPIEHEEQSVVFQYEKKQLRFVLKDETKSSVTPKPVENHTENEPDSSVPLDPLKINNVSESESSVTFTPIENHKIIESESPIKLEPSRNHTLNDTESSATLTPFGNHKESELTIENHQNQTLDKLESPVKLAPLESHKVIESESSVTFGPFESQTLNGAESSVTLGPFEDHTLNHYQGIRTTFGNMNIIDNWSEHLDTALQEQLNQRNFDSIVFQSLDNKSMEDESPIINNVTNLSDNNVWSEEEADAKLRTPDDERSSDSGFRDKGSLSESVEDACEGKYNLEDIEAELEEAFVKGAFNTSEDRDQKSSVHFEYEESKFYEDENKNEEDLSDVDGEIEFWQPADKDYYPEISEFSPVAATGWYLHPPEDKSAEDQSELDDEFVRALRSELHAKLPTQNRTFEREDEEEMSDFHSKLNMNAMYSLSSPLTPIIEENSEPSPKSPNSGVKPRRKNVAGLLESVKNIDNETFMQYLDFMVENEGKDEEDLIEDLNVAADEELSAPKIVITKHSTPQNSFKDDIKFALGYDAETPPISDSDQQPHSIIFEDLEISSSQVVVDEIRPKDDVIFVNTCTNEATILESPKHRSHNTFLTGDYTPDSISPERDISISEDSSRGEAITDINSSPDLLSDFFITPDKTPFQSPRIGPKLTAVEELTTNDEASEIIGELLESGIMAPKIDAQTDQPGSLPHIPQLTPSCTEAFLKSERLHTEDLLLESSKKLERFEMSTSFMGDDDVGSDDGKEGCTEESGANSERVEGSYTPDWESDSEENSTSSGEFIWKQDGGSESKVKVKEASSVDLDISLNENSCKTPDDVKEDVGSKKSDVDDDGANGDDDDDASASTDSASITDFVPSAWDSRAAPSRSALRSPNKRSEKKRRVWFKKEKYLCIYEYPREPSDTEEPETAPSRVIDYSEYADWELQDGDGGDDADESLTDTDTDMKLFPAKKQTKDKYDFYTLSPLEDFGSTGTLSEEGEFFVSSSTRPFQSSGGGGALGPYFTGSQFTAFGNDGLWASSPTTDNLLDETDFVTPDSGVEDLASASSPGESLDLNTPLPPVQNRPECIEINVPEKVSPTMLFFGASKRPARESLTLDLPKSHNADLGLAMKSRGLESV